MTEQPGIGVAWYSPETWRELCALPEAKIDKTYSEFVRTYEGIVSGCAARGVQAVKVPIDIALMVEWCRKHGYEIDSKGRTAFVAALMLAGKDDVMTMPFRDNTRTEH
jgi:hypothetical protein